MEFDKQYTSSLDLTSRSTTETGVIADEKVIQLNIC